MNVLNDKSLYEISGGGLSKSAMLELADELLEMPTICRCGKKARFNGRKIGKEFVSEGNSVEIDDNENIEYESLCGGCYLKKVLKITKEEY